MSLHDPGYDATVFAYRAKVAKAKIAALRAECEALRADADRYRHLRDAAPGEIVFDHSGRDGGHRFVLHVPFDGEPIDNDEESARRLDAAIDNERSKA